MNKFVKSISNDIHIFNQPELSLYVSNFIYASASDKIHNKQIYKHYNNIYAYIKVSTRNGTQ